MDDMNKISLPYLNVYKLALQVTFDFTVLFIYLPKKCENANK